MSLATVFNDMTDTERGRLERASLIREPRHGATILAQGDPGTGRSG